MSENYEKVFDLVSAVMAAGIERHTPKYDIMMTVYNAVKFMMANDSGITIEEADRIFREMYKLIERHNPQTELEFT